MQRITRRASLSIAIRRCRKSAIAVPLIAMASITATRVQADEGGISFWLPGLFGSLAATPQQPGPTLATIYYHASDTGSGNVATSRAVTIGQYNPTLNVGLSGNLKATADLGLVIPGYVFATPIFGGQAAVSVAGIYGRTTASLNATIYGSLGPFPFSRNFEVDDGRTAFGDVIPQLSLRWNAGTSNFMTYITGDAPVGAYNSNQLANLGIGHGAIDAGGGYTYFNPATGYELSATGGFTYNFENTFTQYQNGVDVHLDVGASRFVTKQLQIGA